MRNIIFSQKSATISYGERISIQKNIFIVDRLPVPLKDLSYKLFLVYFPVVSATLR
ncbi:Uncharacterised protein [Porphyromonas endodontalis]|nr:Uncharacterised protein [Porphyromonas endodontalis]